MSGTTRPALPPGITLVTPHLVVDGAQAVLDFYRDAFGAETAFRLPGADGRLMHACMCVDGGMIMLADAWPEFDGHQPSPRTLGGTPVSIHVVVDDVDAVFARAVAAGATPVMKPADMFWGDRYAQLDDPFGHRWALATPQRQVSTDYLVAAAAAMTNPA